MLLMLKISRYYLDVNLDEMSFNKYILNFVTALFHGFMLEMQEKWLISY